MRLEILSGLQTQRALLSSQEGAAEGDHAKQDLKHLLHHIDLPPQGILSLLTVSINSNVKTLVNLKGGKKWQSLVVLFRKW